MNCFEQELRKLLQDQFPDATFVGRCCYVPIGDQIRAKIFFQTGGIASQYNTIRVTILNRVEGTVDTVGISLLELLGMKKSSNPNFPRGIEPHLWEHDNRVEWYAYKPTTADYQLMRNAVNDYMAVFADPRMRHTEGMTLRVR